MRTLPLRRGILRAHRATAWTCLILADIFSLQGEITYSLVVYGFPSLGAVLGNKVFQQCFILCLEQLTCDNDLV